MSYKYSDLDYAWLKRAENFKRKKQRDSLIRCMVILRDGVLLCWAIQLLGSILRAY